APIAEDDAIGLHPAAQTIRLDIPAECRIAGRRRLERANLYPRPQAGIKGKDTDIGTDVPKAARRRERLDPVQSFRLAGCKIPRILQRLRMRRYEYQGA